MQYCQDFVLGGGGGSRGTLGRHVITVSNMASFARISSNILSYVSSPDGLLVKTNGQ